MDGAKSGITRGPGGVSSTASASLDGAKSGITRVPGGVSSDAAEASASGASIPGPGEKVNTTISPQRAAQARDAAKGQLSGPDLDASPEATLERLRQLVRDSGLEIIESEEPDSQKAETKQPVQRKPWDDLNPEQQTEMTKAILQYADANEDMGQRPTRLFNGDEAFVREFYNAYLQGVELLDMWDAPTVNIKKLAAILDAIQGRN